MRIELVKETDSTNNYMKRMPSPESLTMVRAMAQRAGRGQRGNSWEAEAGKNLTISIFFRPQGLFPRDQFAISEATALGIMDYLQTRKVEARVKWPNDIYVDDRKICGILIEHSIMGNELQESIIGVGLNVNQVKFLSDAPNPISMIQITGETLDLDSAAIELGDRIEKRLNAISEESERRQLHEEYKSALWRGNGFHAFRDKTTEEQIAARIIDVEPSGMLILEEKDTEKRRSYAFKEVEFIL